MVIKHFNGGFMFGGFGIILLFLLAGKVVSTVGVPIPGSVLGLLLLTAGLASGLIKREWIEPAVQFLLKHMAFFFIPAGVGVMVHFGVIAKYWVAILIAGLGSFAVVLILTGLIQKVFTSGEQKWK